MSRRSPRFPTARCGGSRSRRRAAPISAEAIARALDARVVSRLGRRARLARGCRGRGWRRRDDPRAAIRGPDGHGTGHATLIRGSAGVAPRGPGVRAAAGGARGARRPRQGQLRPAPHPEPRPHGRAELIPCGPTSPPSSSPTPTPRNPKRSCATCTHCGFCTATCPTYLLLGDELDSPRGRIYLIKDMLARGEAPSADTVKHIDRCLSCLACMTTCPSGVNYMHLVDHGRRWIEEKYRRPWAERSLRRLLGTVLTRPLLFRLALLGRRRWPARSRDCCRAGWRRCWRWRRSRSRAPRRPTGRRIFPAEGERRMRVALLPGCAQRVLAPEINEATIRLLTRHGCEVVVATGERLLRLARPPSRAGGGSARLCPRQYRRLGARAARRRARRDRDQRLGLRHHGQGLRLYAARGPGLCREGGAHRRPRARRDRDRRGARPASDRCRPPGARAAGRLSFGLLDAARPAPSQPAQGIAGRGRVRDGRGAGGAYLLRLGRHLQPAAAGDRRQIARPQARQHRQDRRPKSSPPAISAASPSSQAAATRRSCIRSSCSTGRPAARSRRHCARATRRGGG